MTHDVVVAEPGSTAESETPSRVRRFLKGTLLSDYFVLYIAIAYVLAVSPFADGLLTSRNLANVMSNYWPFLIVVVGQMFVLISAGIDLSQTSIMAVTNVVTALLITERLNPVLFERNPLWGNLLGPDGGPWARSISGIVAASLLAVALGALIGSFNGWAVTKLGMPAFMVTLSSLLFFSAFAVWLTRSENVTALPDEYIAVGKSNLVRGVSYAMLLAIAVAVLVHLTLSRTTYGRWLYSVGANPRAAFVAGVPTARVITAAYTISGACAALSGLLYSTRLEAGRPTLNADLLLDVIGASVIGGVSLFGGKGKVAGAAIGVLFFVLLSNTLNLMQLPFYVVMIVKGVVIAAAAFLDVVRLQTRGAET